MGSERNVGAVSRIVLGVALLAVLWLSLNYNSTQRLALSHARSAVADAIPVQLTAAPANNSTPTCAACPKKASETDVVFEQFKSWLSDYRAATAETKAELETKGATLAQERRAKLKTLIKEDPQRALDVSVSADLRVGLPAAVTSKLEKIIDAHGTLNTCLVGRPGVRCLMVNRAEIGADSYLAHLATVKQRTYPFYSHQNGNIKGIAIDNQLAVRNDEQRNILVATRNASSSWTTGPKTIFCALYRYSDGASNNNGSPVINPFVERYSTMSYGLTQVQATCPAICFALSQPWSYYDSTGADPLAEVNTLIAQAGYDLNNYTIHAYIDVNDHANGGWASGTTAYSEYDFDTMCHEVGHTYGLWHSCAWVTNDGSIIGSNGSHDEYGNNQDFMGYGWELTHTFNAYQRNSLGWLPDSSVKTVSGNGTYRLYAFDISSLTAGNSYALRVPKDSAHPNYWLQLRQTITDNQWVSNGIEILWTTPSDYNNGEGGNELLDTTPFSPNYTNDGALTIGRTFSDYAADIHITPVAIGGTGNKYVDVVVNRGTIVAGDRAPTVTLAGPNTAAVNANSTFTATASDPDGDTLAYSWDFDDGNLGAYSTNTSTATKNWSSAGQYHVRCTVSDMKGCTASASIIVTVGSPTISTISGTVKNSAGAGIPDVCVTTGETDWGGFKNYVFTNADGSYTLTNVPSGSFTMAAYKADWTFTANFSNPISPSKTGINFTGTQVVHNVGGKITDNLGSGLSGVTVSDGTRNAVSNSSGDYLITGVPAGTYTLTPTKSGVTFAPATSKVSVALADVSGMNFTGATSSAPPSGPGGGITRDWWLNISGTAVSNLTSNSAYPNSPSGTETIKSFFEAPSNLGDNYGERMRGYFIAPLSGSYYFYIASDDNGELWLSTDNNPSNKRLIANVPDWTNSREWTKFASQKSAAVTLTSGQRYYIEALMKEGGGGDNLAVGVQYPTGYQEMPIPYHRLDPWSSAPGNGPGSGITREWWLNIGSGTAVSNLTSNAAYPNSPTGSEKITTAFEAPTNWADNYGERMRGYYIAPTTGNYTFYIASDDNGELWLSTDTNPANKRLIASVSSWTNSREWTKYSSQQSAAIALTAGQRYYIEALMKEGGGGDNLAVGAVLPGGFQEMPIPYHRLDPWVTQTTGTGLTAEYYDNMDLTALKVTRVDPTVNFNWGTGSPDPTVGADTFSARWSGSVQAQYTATYTFYTQSDDGVRLWVNGQQLINNWTNHGSTENSGTISLVAGQKYSIKMEYYENGGDAVAMLKWSCSSTPKQIIPQSQLYPLQSKPENYTSTGTVVSLLVDTDGDGLFDAFEISVGLNPLLPDTDGNGINDDLEKTSGGTTTYMDAQSVWLAQQTAHTADITAASGTLEVTRLSGSLRFDAPQKDKLSLVGTIPDLSLDQLVSGSVVSIYVSGVSAVFTLDDKGNAKTSDGTIVFKNKNGDQTTFAVALRNGTWSGILAEAGIDPNDSTKNGTIHLAIEVTVDGKRFAAELDVTYTSRANKGAKLKH